MNRWIFAFTLLILCTLSVLCNSPMFLSAKDVTRFFCEREIYWIQLLSTKLVSIIILFLNLDSDIIIVSSKLSCGGTSRLKKISLRNPAPIVNDCRYTVKPSNLRVCQVKSGIALFNCKKCIWIFCIHFPGKNWLRYGFGSAAFER